MAKETKEKKKFYSMTIEERWDYLKKINKNASEALELYKKGLDIKTADAIIENVIATSSLPIGIVFIKINGKNYTVPLSLEEPSVIAGANRAAKLTLEEGFTSHSSEQNMIGEIQIVGNEKEIDEKLKDIEEDLQTLFINLTKNMKRYGGGFRSYWTKHYKSDVAEFTVLYFEVNVGDAMGANKINTIAEEVGNFLKENGLDVNVKILSNLAIKRLVKAEAIWRWEKLEKDSEKRGYSAKEMVRRFILAYEMAKTDPFRLATHNKGIMNGIDGVALAFGQDFRAIESGAHTYAAYKGLKPLTHWEQTEEGLKGTIEIPIQVGTVGGAINSLNHAKASLKLANISSAKELAEVMGAIGLANNFAAISAIVTEGINKGHMKLHARNLALMLGATPEEAKKISEIIEPPINLAKVEKLLQEIKNKDKY